jgi:hypothetical protein
MIFQDAPIFTLSGLSTRVVTVKEFVDCEGLAPVLRNFESFELDFHNNELQNHEIIVPLYIV